MCLGTFGTAGGGTLKIGNGRWGSNGLNEMVTITIFDNGTIMMTNQFCLDLDWGIHTITLEIGKGGPGDGFFGGGGVEKGCGKRIFIHGGQKPFKIITFECSTRMDRVPTRQWLATGPIKENGSGVAGIDTVNEWFGG